MRSRFCLFLLHGCLLLLGTLAGIPTSLSASSSTIVGTDGLRLQTIIDRAAPHEKIILEPGLYQGPGLINKPLILESTGAAIIDGGGKGRVVTIDAPDVTVRGLTIRNSGRRLDIEDSGVFVTPEGHNATVENNKILNNLIGVYLKGPNNAKVIRNLIEGDRTLRVNERGNGVQLWRTPGSIVSGNTISWGRDGIFVTTSKQNKFSNNHIKNVRFAVHYMYTNESEVSDNLSEGNHLGYAIMYARKIRIFGNRSTGDRDHGILLNYANDSVIERNHVSGGAKKCVFFYNANKNKFSRNVFEGCGIGIHFTAGSERNQISENTFQNNRSQVKYVGTRSIEWSVRGLGNYWSDNLSYDLNGDGIADRPYKPNSMVDQIVWRHPSAKLLLQSPAFLLLNWVQSIFPSLFPGGVTDSAPLIKTPELSELNSAAATKIE